MFEGSSLYINIFRVCWFTGTSGDTLNVRNNNDEVAPRSALSHFPIDSTTTITTITSSTTSSLSPSSSSPTSVCEQ